MIFYLVVASWRGQLVRNCGEMHSWGGLLPRVSVFSVFSVCVCVCVCACFLCVCVCVCVFSVCVFSIVAK